VNNLLSAQLKYLFCVTFERPEQEGGQVNVVCNWLS